MRSLWKGLAGAGFAIALVAVVRTYTSASTKTPKPPAESPRVQKQLPEPRDPPPRSVIERGAAAIADGAHSAAAAVSADPEPPRAAASAPLPPESASSLPSALAPTPEASASAVQEVVHEPRRVLRAAVAAWSKPGLCTNSFDAASVRETMTSNFRRLELGEKGALYLDPRLPADAERPLLGSVDQAEKELRLRLGLLPPRPTIFVYFDQQLLKAAACINEEVAAFYDGALHVVAGRPDLPVSMLHEYSHHALFHVGLSAPTWAQEGIAMNIARERWWQEPHFLAALLDRPFSMDDMDRSIAYKLKPEQAIAFYVQSAALVECVLRARHWSLRELFSALSSGASPDSVSYDLPELDRRSFLRECVEQGFSGAPAGR